MTTDQIMGMDLILVRGLPGSGKTSLCALLSEKGKYPVFSVDQYFTDQGGNYSFRFEENHLAYKACQEQCRKAMTSKSPKIFIDNVFSPDSELQPYFKLAEKFGYRVHVITVEHRHDGINTHNIPDEQIRKMAEKYRVVLHQ